MTWTQFLRSQAAVACDFASVDTALLRRYYLLFFIDVTTREWTTQAARNLFLKTQSAPRSPTPSPKDGSEP